MIVDTPLPVLLETLTVNADADMRAELQKIQMQNAELIPAASLTVYPGAGHGPYASDHDTLNADLLAFINGHHPQPGLPHHART